MDEKRLQEYLESIKKLLSCSTDEEINQILLENKNLVDVGFLQTLEATAQMVSDNGDENTANLLRYLANALDKALKSSPSVSKASPTVNVEHNLESLSEEEIQAYKQFLLEVLQATNESNGNAQVVYSLLAANIDKLDDNLAEVLRLWATNLFEILEQIAANFVAATINNFSNFIREFPLGNKTSNVEIAITGYEVVLTIFTKDASPENWAMTQNNLGIAYRERIKGDKSDNIEKAIFYYKDALTVRTRNDFPQQWATTQNNLGNAYKERIKGDKADNIELAILCYQHALEEYTRNGLPQQWAMTQHNLGTAYSERIEGNKADNIELAILCYQHALKVYTRNDFPQNWATTQYNLGAVYSERIEGNKADNIELAILCYQHALKVYTRNDFPQQWATTQNNLGLTYNIYRIKGDKADNIEKAILCCKDALKVYTRNDFPQQWALIQNNLGIAYRERIKGDKADNIEKAILCYEDALTVRTRNDFPQYWADTQTNLGNAYRRRIKGDKGDKADNIELAILCYKNTLTVRTRNDFPQQWALTQNNLGNVYTERIKGNKADNIELAILCYQHALKVYTRNDFPQNWADTLYNLGNVYTKRIKGNKADNIELAINSYKDALTITTRNDFPEENAETLSNLGFVYQDEKRLNEAYTTFEQAIETVEYLRGEIISGDETKRKQAEKWNVIYRRMVEVCLELKEDTQAIEYAERSKTRNLVELILERDSKIIFPPEVATQLEQLRDEIAKGQYQIQNGKAENSQLLGQHLQQLRKQRNELQDKYLPVGSGFKFDSFQNTLDERTAIIEWYILYDKILAFIIKPTGKITIWQSQPKDLEALADWGDQYLKNYYNQNHKWRKSLKEELKELASILHIDEISSHIPKHCDRLILIPHQYLHLFPLHTLPVKTQNSENPSCLLDLFPGGVGYAPSCQILQQVQQRQRNDFQSLFAIQNPTGDLIYTNLEVEVIQGCFTSSNVLKQTAATLTAINNSNLNTYHCTHFSCHGAFNLINPGKSALILANAPTANPPQNPDTERYLNLRLGETHDLEECLTLNKIFTLKLEKCRLVTLSACETGLIDFGNTSDEYIGLPSGFMLAGSPSVVSSLWKVDDVSTSLLMIKFYKNLFKLDKLQAGDIAVALQEAQKWLRNLTIVEFDEFLEEHKPQIEKVLAQLRPGQRIIFELSLERIRNHQPLPFANPYYWAGFTASGY